MEVNLSEEMIEKITCTAFMGRQTLRKQIEEVEAEEATTERAKAKKRIMLNDLRKALSGAEEVHALFLELLEEVENQ